VRTLRELTLLRLLRHPRLVDLEAVLAPGAPRTPSPPIARRTRASTGTRCSHQR
jgi:hypothetical protein